MPNRKRSNLSDKRNRTRKMQRRKARAQATSLAIQQQNLLLEKILGPSEPAFAEHSIPSQSFCLNVVNKVEHIGEQHVKNQRLRNQQSHDRWQMDSALPTPKISKCVQLTTKTPVQQDSSLAQASQNITKPAQVLTSPFEITPSKSKLVKDPNQTTVSKSIIRKTDLPKQKLLVTSHEHSVMSNLASMWRSRKLCDASISNGSSTVMVHKIVLSAVSPKLFSVISTCISSQFYEVKFPEVSTETLMAFTEYMYTGLLDLDLNILQQLKVIAKQLDMKDLQNMCDAHLQSGAHQQLASTVTAFDDTRQMPSDVSAVPTEDIKQEISQNELAQLKEGTVRTVKREFEAASLDTNGGNSPFGSVILPTVKIEPVGPDDDKYGQMNKRACTSSSVSDSSQALNTPLNSITVSTTDFSLPFSDTTNSKATTSGACQLLTSTVTAFDDTRQMPSSVSTVPTEDIKQISQNELAQLKEGTVRTVKREFEAASLDTNSGNSPFGSVILPTVKIEPVGPDDKYGQMNKRACTSSSVSDSSQALNTPLNSIAISTTDFSLPFSDTTNSKATNKIYGTSPKLKSNVFESSPVSDLSPVSYSEEKLCSQSRLIKEDPSKPLNRTITTPLIDNNVTYGSSESVYPVGLFTAEGDRLPLSSTQVTNVKNTGLYKTDGLT